MGPRRQSYKQQHQLLVGRHWWRRLVLLLLVVFLVLGGLLWWWQTTWWQITTITVSGNRLVASEAVTKVVTDTLTGRVAGLLPRAHIWFWPAAELEANLLASLPRLHNVKLYRRQRQELVVAVTERQPVAIWCRSVASPCDFLDDTGLAFSPAPQFSRPIYFTILANTATSSLAANLPPSAAELAWLLGVRPDLVAAFNQSWWGPVTINTATQLAGGDESWLVVPATSTPFTLFSNWHQDPALLLLTLRTVLGSGETMADLRTHQLDLDYLDLRFAPKAAYRFRE